MRGPLDLNWPTFVVRWTAVERPIDACQQCGQKRAPHHVLERNGSGVVRELCDYCFQQQWEHEQMADISKAPTGYRTPLRNNYEVLSLLGGARW